MTETTGSSSPGGLFSGIPPRVITISGANKDIGKSSLAAYLAGHCRGCAGIKVSVHGEKPEGEAVLEETGELAGSDTDTARLLRAGARPVFWIRTTAENLPEHLGVVLERLEAPAVIVEGNSVLEHLEPDYAIFIMGPTFEDFKPSANNAIAKAHTVVINGSERLDGGRILELEREIKRRNPDAKAVVVSELGREAALNIVLSRVTGRLGGEHMRIEADEKVLEAVKAKAEEGRISCAVALRLAKELGVPPIEVGKAANVLNLKISKCSLGCF
ncbi:MAG: hypothetical protein SWK76_10625 [Actinomycetota bacterium]|nr:hypothetical protein [Actinomycetota bacterium]